MDVNRSGPDKCSSASVRQRTISKYSTHSCQDPSLLARQTCWDRAAHRMQSFGSEHNACSCNKTSVLQSDHDLIISRICAWFTFASAVTSAVPARNTIGQLSFVDQAPCQLYVLFYTTLPLDVLLWMPQAYVFTLRCLELKWRSERTVILSRPYWGLTRHTHAWSGIVKSQPECSSGTRIFLLMGITS
jgi:hypothetical protein